MGKRHLEPNEIKMLMKKKAQQKREAITTPFTGMSTLANYCLFRKYHYNQTKLVKYNTDAAEYREDIDNGFYTYDDLQARILEKVPDLNVESVDYTEDENIYKKSDRFMHMLGNIDIANNNTINREAVRYLLIFFNVLIDHGFDVKKINKAKDYMNDYLDAYMYGAQSDKKRIMELWRELREEAGIEIEMPN